MAPLLDLGADALGGVLQQRAEIEHLGVEGEPAGFDLREIEQVIDQLQQVAAVAGHGREEVPLGLAERTQVLGEQHFAEADDAVQRRAQLVRHVRQKLALHLTGALELRIQSRQLVGLIFEERRGTARLGRATAGALMRRFPLTGDGQIGEGDFQRRPLIGGQGRHREECEQRGQASPDPQRHQRHHTGGRAGDAQFRACLGRGAALQLTQLLALAHQFSHDRAPHAQRLDAGRNGGGPLVGVETREIQHQGLRARRGAHDAERAA